MVKDFTIREFGSAVNLSRVTIWRMIKDGQLHAYKVRNATRIPFGELARIQKENRIKPCANKLSGCH